MLIASFPQRMNNDSMKVDISGSSKELAALIKEDPSLIERELLNQGNEYIAIYEDRNFTNGFQNLKEMKRELFTMVLEDIGMGAVTLKTSVVGLTFSGNKVKTYISPFGTNPQGNVMFSVSLKNVVAFRNWRNGTEDLPQDELNAALYKVVVALSEVL